MSQRDELRRTVRSHVELARPPQRRGDGVPTMDRSTAGAIELRPVDTDLLGALLRRRAGTVTVVTAPGLPVRRGRASLAPAGCTATSFTSASSDPPLVSFCLDRASSSRPTIERTEHLAVHLLPSGQREAARAFAAEVDRAFVDAAEAARVFAAADAGRRAGRPGWTVGPFGVPLLDAALAVLLCRVVHRVTAGAHTVVIAEPLALGAGQGGPGHRAQAGARCRRADVSGAARHPGGRSAAARDSATGH
ncbi:flavin reductase family protein [Micromonospora sp. DT233]|uniref:flavin reductase family protein n=1 Tax=Micromonospora sp. DT233 TaxID=3393432 RepID=UPI003CEE247D